MLIIKGGEIHDGIRQEGYQADILVEGGKIKRIEPRIQPPENARVTDARGLLV